MAIDQDIQQRVDAYRSNPQALMQRYQQNQQLLDLLALQRLKSEKDDAARKVQMEMQQTPQTIKQQREQQLLDMTKQDLAQQTAGIMRNAQQRQQRNMQQVARQGAASPQQMQQVASGLGALAQRQPAQRMAAGGIVAFQEGGEVTQAEIDEYREYLRRIVGSAYSGEDITNIPDERIRQEILAKRVAPQQAIPRSEDPSYELTRRGYRPTQANALDIAAQQGPERKPSIAPPPQQEPEPGPIPTLQSAPKTDPDPRAPLQEPPPQLADGSEDTYPPLPAGGLISMLQAENNKLTAPTIDPSKALNRGNDILAKTGLGSLEDPEAARRKAQEEAAKYLGRDEKRDRMNQYLDELKALDIRQQDPDELRRRRLSAFMRGTAGRASTALAAGSGAMANEQRRQERSERDRLLKRLDIEKSAMDMDVSIGKDALTAGISASEQAMLNRRQAADILRSTSDQDTRLVIAQAQLDFEANKHNIANILTAANIEYTNELKKTLDATNAVERASANLTKLQVQKRDFFDDQLANDPTYRTAEIAARENPDDPNAKAALDAAYKAVQTRVNNLYSLAGLNETEELFKQIIDSQMRGNTNPTQPTDPSFDLEKWGDKVDIRDR